MKKIIPYILAFSGWILLIVAFLFSKGCNKPEYLHLPESYKSDSIQRVKTNAIVAKYDSVLAIKQSQDSAYKVQIKTLKSDYYALRRIVKGLQVIKIDSAGQTVDHIPAEQYNALIESGNKCDSLIVVMQDNLDLKDSIISDKGIQVKALKDLSKTSEQAISDLKSLAKQEYSKRNKAEKLTRKIPMIIGGTFIATWILLSLAMQ